MHPRALQYHLSKSSMWIAVGSPCFSARFRYPGWFPHTWNCCSWEARIYETGKQRFLGYYTSEVAAAQAYDARAVQLHGSAAKVNFPEDYNETRGNPPAVKAFSALAVPNPSQKRRAASRSASIHSGATRQSIPSFSLDMVDATSHDHNKFQ